MNLPDEDNSWFLKFQQSRQPPKSDTRRSISQLAHQLLNIIIATDEDLSDLDNIIDELEFIDERLIHLVTDKASECLYTKACMLRFLALASRQFGNNLVRLRLLPALNATKRNASDDPILELFMDIRISDYDKKKDKFSSMEDVLQIDTLLKEQYPPRPPGITQLYTIDRRWIPAFVVCVTKVVISMQDTTPTWTVVAETVAELVSQSVSNLIGGWLNAGLCLAATALMEAQEEHVTGLAANDILEMIKNKFTFSCLLQAADTDEYTFTMRFLRKITTFLRVEDPTDSLMQKVCKFMPPTTWDATEFIKALEAKSLPQMDTSTTEQSSVCSEPNFSSVAYCVLQHAILCLIVNDKDKFLTIVRAVEKSHAIPENDRCCLWYNWFRYLATFGNLFLECSQKGSREYERRHHYLTITTQWMTNSSMDFFADLYVSLVEETDVNPSASREEKVYIQHASQQTILIFFLNRGGGDVSAIRRFLHFFPSAFPHTPWGGDDKALKAVAFQFLEEKRVSAPPSLINDDGLVDITILEKRVLVLAQEEEQRKEKILWEARQQQLLAEQVRKDQLLFEQAQDYAVKQRQLWLSNDEHKRQSIVDVDVDDGIVETQEMSEARGHPEQIIEAADTSVRFQAPDNLMILDAVTTNNSVDADSAVDSDAVEACDDSVDDEEEPGSNQDEDSDDVVEILDSFSEDDAGEVEVENDTTCVQSFNDKEFQNESADEATIDENSIAGEDGGDDENNNEYCGEHVDVMLDEVGDGDDDEYYGVQASVHVDEDSEDDHEMEVDDDEEQNFEVDEHERFPDGGDQNETANSIADDDQAQSPLQDYDESPEDTCERVEEVVDAVHGEDTIFVHNQKEEFGEIGSQVDTGYEPDTAAHTEGEVSEDLQTEEEEDDDEEEKEGCTAESEKIIKDGTVKRPPSRYVVAYSYSDSHMDAADEQTASDIGAESSEMEDGTSVRKGVHQPPPPLSPFPVSTLIEAAFSAQRAPINEELATDICRNVEHLHQSERDGRDVLMTLIGNAGTSIATSENELVDASQEFDTKFGSEEEVAAEADIDTEPEQVESQPETESFTEKDSNRIVHDDSDATEEFPPVNHYPAVDTIRTDYDADLSETPRIDDDEVVGDDGSIEYPMDPPPSRPAKIQNEKSVSFQDNNDDVDQPVPCEMPPGESETCVPAAGNSINEVISESGITIGVELDHCIGEGAIMPMDTPTVILDRNSIETDAPSDSDRNQENENKIGFKHQTASSKVHVVVDRLPHSEASRPVLSRDLSTMVQTGIASDEGSLSADNDVIDDQPVEKPLSSVLTRDLSMQAQTDNNSDDQIHSMDDKADENCNMQTRSEDIMSVDPTKELNGANIPTPENRVVVEGRSSIMHTVGDEVEHEGSCNDSMDIDIPQDIATDQVLPCTKQALAADTKKIAETEGLYMSNISAVVPGPVSLAEEKVEHSVGTERYSCSDQNVSRSEDGHDEQQKINLTMQESHVPSDPVDRSLSGGQDEFPQESTLQIAQERGTLLTPSKSGLVEVSDDVFVDDVHLPQANHQIERDEHNLKETIEETPLPAVHNETLVIVNVDAPAVDSEPPEENVEMTSEKLDLTEFVGTDMSIDNVSGKLGCVVADAEVSVDNINTSLSEHEQQNLEHRVDKSPPLSEHDNRASTVNQDMLHLELKFNDAQEGLTEVTPVKSGCVDVSSDVDIDTSIVQQDERDEVEVPNIEHNNLFSSFNQESNQPTRSAHAGEKGHKEENISVASPRKTRSGTASIQTTTTAASKRKLDAKGSSPTSRRHQASPTSINADESSIEAPDDIEGRTVDFVPDSPALSSIAPSSVMSSGGHRSARTTNFSPLKHPKTQIKRTRSRIGELNAPDEKLDEPPTKRRGRPRKVDMKQVEGKKDIKRSQKQVLLGNHGVLDEIIVENEEFSEPIKKRMRNRDKHAYTSEEERNEDNIETFQESSRIQEKYSEQPQRKVKPPTPLKKSSRLQMKQVEDAQKKKIRGDEKSVEAGSPESKMALKKQPPKKVQTLKGVRRSRVSQDKGSISEVSEMGKVEEILEAESSKEASKKRRKEEDNHAHMKKSSGGRVKKPDVTHVKEEGEEQSKEEPLQDDLPQALVPRTRSTRLNKEVMPSSPVPKKSARKKKIVDSSSSVVTRRSTRSQR